VIHPIAALAERFAFDAACGVVLIMLGGCASPREHLYILDNQPADAIDTPEIRITVLLGPVSVRSEVDRLRSLAPYVVLHRRSFVSSEYVPSASEVWDIDSRGSE
jgi:hypothetical protein